MPTIRFHTRPRQKSYLYIGLGLLLILIAYVYFLPPASIFAFLGFFVVEFTAVFYLMRFIFNQTRRALLISLAQSLFLILRALGLKQWIYPTLIVALFVTLELYWKNRS